MAAPPTTDVHTHVEAQDMRDLAKAHGPERTMSYGCSIELDDQIPSMAVGERRDSLPKARFQEFVSLRHEHSIELANDSALSLTEHRSIFDQGIADVAHDS